MNIVKIQGGLGNQMFQYAFARALMENGKAVKIDCSSYDSQSNNDTRRNFELDRFDIVIDKASDKDIQKYYNLMQKIISYFERIIGCKISRIVIEREHCFHPELITCDNKLFIGYWQSEKYFKDIRNILLKEFNFEKFKLSDKNKRCYNDILNKNNAVAVHIRGGDYNQAGNVSVYGNICTIEYYKKAFEYIESTISDATFFVFTNDNKWASKILSNITQNYIIIDWNTEEDGWSDLYLMSQCKHNIIANSSFSWWAAWLNQNEQKIVIAPKRWQNGSDIVDIVPDDWIRM